MSVELRPLGVLCNIQCRYCYQQPQRDAGKMRRAYDIEKMKAAVDATGGPFTLFGGEPLLLPLQDLEDLWAWGYQRYGRNNVQTNGTLITDDHIRLFERYNVHVGVSLDGPGPLNDARWHGTFEKTRESTNRAQRALEELCRHGLGPALILTLHRLNASSESLPILLAWVEELHTIGVRRFRLHLLESESAEIRRSYGLSSQENIDALLAFLEMSRRVRGLDFDVFVDMRQLLRGEDRLSSCVWSACDPYTTRAVRGIEGHGQRSNCGRTNKEGVDFVKASEQGFERYLALYNTPQSAGGCKGCRFFLMCKGQCPGTAADGDWRNRTEHCEVWMTLFQQLESELKDHGEIPLSLSDSRGDIERQVINTWSKGMDVSIGRLLGRPSPSPTPRKTVGALQPGVSGSSL